MAKIYDRLGANKFRLLTILPSSDVDDRINCELSVHPLGQHPDYVAISYCWGKITSERQVNFDGEHLQVRENVECILRKLQCRDKKRVIWIDSICINQEDSNECGQQVLYMKDIYQQATQVLVWLGLAYEESDLVFELCNRLLMNKRLQRVLEASNSVAPDFRVLLNRRRREQIRIKLTELELSESSQNSKANKGESRDTGTPSQETTALLGDIRRPIPVKSDGLVHSGELDNITDEEVQALYRLLKRPYWNRFWIIQEFCLANKAVLGCGDIIIESEAFLMAIFMALLLSSDAPSGRLRRIATASTAMLLLEARITFKQELEKFDILDTLCQFRTSLATNPLDKVYGIFGLLSEDERQLFDDPNYAVPIIKCYTNAAQAIFKSRGNLDCLTVDRISKPKITSWVPDWRKYGRILLRLLNLDSLIAEPKIDERWPSWVPDWRDFRYGLSGLPRGSHESSFTAEGETSIFRSFSASHTCHNYNLEVKDPSILVLSGFDIDTLSVVTEAPKEFISDFSAGSQESLTTIQYLKLWITTLVRCGQYFDTMVEWEKLALSGATYPTRKDPLSKATYPTEEDPLRVLCEIIAVSDMRGGKEKTFKEFQRWMKKFEGPKKLSYAKTYGLHKLGSVYDLALALAGIRDAFRNLDGTYIGKIEHIFSRKLGRTQRGYLALVPELSHAGDKIALFKGGKMPFVVREQKMPSEQKGRWELIGCSYVHGIMFGELWDESECKEMEII